MRLLHYDLVGDGERARGGLRPKSPALSSVDDVAASPPSSAVESQAPDRAR
jgi:hypothetical protein